MPQIEITWSVELPEEPITLVDLEEFAGEQARELAREIIREGIVASEPAVLAQTPGARQRIKSRYVFTSFGEVRYRRWKLRRPDGTYTYPLDQALGLSAHQTVSPGVFSTLSWLAAQLPFQLAAEVASQLWGVAVNPKRVWRLTQKAGERCRELFSRGLGGSLPDLPAGGYRHQMLVVQADGTGLRCRDGPVEAKICCWYTDARIIHTGQQGPRRRVYLEHKGVYASLQPVSEFGRTAYRLCERHVRGSAAYYRLAVSDAGGWIPRMFRSTFDIPWHQLDHFHGRRRLIETPGLPAGVAEHLWRWTLEEQHDAVDREIQRRADQGELSAEEATNLLGYLHTHRKKLWASRILARHGAPQHLCTRWSAAIEHTVDLLVARRMKKKGMHWSRQGAANMLALRTVLLNRGAWKEVFHPN